LANTVPAPEPPEAPGAGAPRPPPALSAQKLDHRLASVPSSHAPLEEIAALEAQAQLSRPELDHAAYDEYVRGFDDVPTLVDVVGSPPRRVFQPDFRRGERPDRRKAPRLDALTEREARSAALEQAYLEYTQPAGLEGAKPDAELKSAADATSAPAPTAGKKPKRAKSRKPGKRKKR
jgi:hypothetical protein